MPLLRQTTTLMKNISRRRSCSGIIIGDLAELCNKQFFSKSSCDAINVCRHFNEKSFAFKRQQSKFNFRYATHFFGEISRIEKEICIKCARVTSKM